jgi:hypothetical protein
MSTQNNMDQLNGLFKQLYADKIQMLVPDGVKLAKRIKFSERQKLGDYFNQPVNLSRELGFTYGGEDGGAFTLQSAVAGQTKNAQVRGVEIVLRSNIPFNSILRSQNVSKAAFVGATKYVVQNMMDSFFKLLETDLLYGQSGLGAVSTTSGNTITIQSAEWAAGIWSGGENMPLELRSSAGVLRGYCNIASVDITNKAITVDALPAGAASGDVLWHRSAYNNQFAGVHKIITNTSSLFGINASTYQLWQGNSDSGVTGTLSFTKLVPVISKAVAKGLEGKVLCMVSNPTWDDLLSDLASKRQYDTSYKSAEISQGAESIVFYSQNGAIEVVPSIYVKEGYAYLLDEKTFERIGSSDVTFEQPEGMGKYMRILDNQHGYDVRAYTDQALFCKAPGRNSIVSGFTNTN